MYPIPNLPINVEAALKRYESLQKKQMQVTEDIQNIELILTDIDARKNELRKTVKDIENNAEMNKMVNTMIQSEQDQKDTIVRSIHG